MRLGWSAVVVAAAGCTSGGMANTTTGAATFAGTSSSSVDDTAGQTGSADADGGSLGTTTAASTGAEEPPDLAAGSWSFENVSNTPPQSIHGIRTVVDDGREVVAWAENSLGDLSVLNIFGAIGSVGAWQTTALTAFDDIQNTFPAIASAGDEAVLVWSGQETMADDRDVFLAVSDGSGWGTPRNVTDTFDDVATPNDDTEPVVLLKPSGSVVMGFVSSAPPSMVLPPPDVFVTEFMLSNDPSTRAMVVSQNDVSACWDLTGALDGDGTAHIIANCSSQLFHITDRSGDWDSDALAGVTSGIFSPSLSAGPDGEAHLVWIQNEQCGVDTCSDVFYAATAEGVFSTPINVSNSANLEERFPTVGQDRWGRVLVFAQARVDNLTDIYLYVADDGSTFSAVGKITPDDTNDGYGEPAAVAFTADGYPSFVLGLGVDGSDPFNSEIMIARFEPG